MGNNTDRLLSEQELEKIHVANQCRSYDYIVSQWIKAQDAKSVAARDKWWVSNLNGEFTVIRLTDELDDVAEGDYVVMPVKRWNELKEKTNG
jgi:hypothetical protein